MLQINAESKLLEAQGLLQINEPEIKKLADKIYSDLIEEKYLQREFTDEKSSIFKTFGLYYNCSDIYVLHYEPDDIQWLKNLDIVVGYSSDDISFNKPVLKDDVLTIYSNDSIIVGTIGIVNVDICNISNKSVYNSLCNYYKDFKRFQQTGHRISDCGLFDSALEHYNEVLSLIYSGDLDKNMDNVYNLMTTYHNSFEKFVEKFKNDEGIEIINILNGCLYFLNNDAIDSNIENIFCEFEQYKLLNHNAILSLKSEDLVYASQISRVYFFINRFLDFIDDNVTAEQDLFIKNRIGHIYYKIFVKGVQIDDDFDTFYVLNTHNICKKFKYKLKRLQKHFNAINNYCNTKINNFYENDLEQKR